MNWWGKISGKEKRADFPDVATTLRYYVDVFPEYLEEVADVLAGK